MQFGFSVLSLAGKLCGMVNTLDCNNCKATNRKYLVFLSTCGQKSTFSTDTWKLTHSSGSDAVPFRDHHRQGKSMSVTCEVFEDLTDLPDTDRELLATARAG